MSIHAAQQNPSTGDNEHISRETLERWLNTHGEGDSWDFKETLGDLTDTSVRVNLAKDALAFCNLSEGGTLVVGVTDNYTKVGLGANERVDTTAIRQAIEKYIDGDFLVLAAEHEVPDPDNIQAKRFGIIYFRRKTPQPMLAAKPGDILNSNALFRSGDILVRRGAASIRANSEDVRQLLTNTVVHERRINAINEVWSCVLEQREFISDIEFLYDILPESEYGDAIAKPELRQSLGTINRLEHAKKVHDLHRRLRCARPYIPEQLFQQCRHYFRLLHRIHAKTIGQRDAERFLSWTKLEGGSPDEFLREIASRLIPKDQLDLLWAGQGDSPEKFFTLRLAIDTAEENLCQIIRQVLSGMA
jgi:hypothetical protein